MTLKCHRLVLMAQSPKLDRQFESGMEDQQDIEWKVATRQEADDCVAASQKLAGECGEGTGHNGTTKVTLPGDDQIRQCDDKTACHAKCVLNNDCTAITASGNTL